MTATFKIRLLLFMLTVSLAVTALTINFTFDKTEILDFDAKSIENALHKKEHFVKRYLYGPDFDSLRFVHNNPAQAVKLVTQLKDERNIYLFTYSGHQLVFWGSNRIAPVTDLGLKEGSNLIKTDNGTYEAIKRTSADFSALAIIPIRAEYHFQNKYLKNIFSPDLIKENNLEIAEINDEKVYNIKNADGKYLIAVKLKSNISNTFYSKLELCMWLLAAFLGTVFINYLCISLAGKGLIKSAAVVFFIYFLGLRILTLEYHWIDTYFNIPIFDSKHFHAGYFFPSLGDFLLNGIMTSWFLCFLYSYRNEISISEKPISKNWNLIAVLLSGIIIYLFTYKISEIFHQLVIRSNINFDVTNILYLNSYSWLGILLMCTAVFNIYILIEVILVISKQFPFTNKERLRFFIAGIILLFIGTLVLSGLNVFILLFGSILFLRGWAYYNQNHGYKLAIFLLTLLLFSIISSVKLSGFQFLKEREHRKVIAKKLQQADDANAVLLFPSIEKKLLKDGFAEEYSIHEPPQRSVFQNKLRKSYFDGYLSRYEIRTHSYNSGGRSVYEEDSTSLSTFKNLVLRGSIKVSDYFYRVNNTFGFQNYFAIIPVGGIGKNSGTLVVQLKAKTFEDPASFPEVLHDGKTETTPQINNYSFAFYNNGRLINQKGNYNYSLVDNALKTDQPGFSFIDKNGYNHVLYQPNGKKLILVSKPGSTWIMRLASVSFLFLVLITFSVIIILLHQLWVVFHDDDFRLNNYNWNYLLSRNRILYKTRIQASMVIAIIFTLLVVGGITYVSIGKQFRVQQEADVLAHATRINEALENNDLFSNNKLTDSDELLNYFADINATDLNLFDLKGNLFFSTQPKIYDQGIIERRMNALAFNYVSRYQRSEYLNHERIGLMNYISAYKPIRNNNNETIAFLSLPHFSNEQEYEQRIGSFLNALINVYALVLIIIALFAVFLANQITHPLTIVAKNLSEIAIGSRHEPIQWKSNDEIGTLIQEYNKMIAALEESAQKLAKSERESAWREMAKQVAHEIKNPLTPLKLGVQLLEKSWKANDPNFDKKFDKFSKSFIEQIDSLSLIASEFSNFAKMPDTPFENVNLNNLIQKTIDVFEQTEDLEINFIVVPEKDIIVRGGKDHLLRIFNNLLKNSIEAIPDYRKGKISINLEIQDRQAVITMSDNGKGIPEELHSSIFNHNFTTKSSGTGLGLAFVKQAVENMYGTIQFETGLNKGTTFYIKLPLA